jgi:UDP-2,4-diacetamido-2,4,6-trideoxy-beta-L-altropyranose hydrolase
MTRIAIRVDASTAVGTGHLKRCLSLAQALTDAGLEIRFVCRRIDTVASQVLGTDPCATRWLPAPTAAFAPEPEAPPHAAWAGVPQIQDAADTSQALADWCPDAVVVDHYAFDARWHGRVRDALGCRLLVIDDIADRALDADALLDPNWDADHHAKYAGLLQREPLWLCGPRFALLSSGYRNAARYVFCETVRSIGIFMGGTDPGGISARALTACRNAGFTGAVEVVSTAANPQLAELRNACQQDGQVTLTLDQPDLAGFFYRHDLQIGAGGGATWERCRIGAPTVALALVANQSAVVPGLAALGAVRAADEENLPGVLRQLIADPAARRSLAQRAGALVDGRGAQRVALALLHRCQCAHLQLRPATVDDARLLHGWRNHPAVRTVSATQEPIAFGAHQRWLQAVLANPARWLFVACVGQLPVGSIRFDRVDSGHLDVSLYTDPDLQGLGVGQRLLAAGELALLALHPSGFTVVAQVLPGNTASQRLFHAGGYHGGPLQYRKAVGPLPNTPHTAP